MFAMQRLWMPMIAWILSHKLIFILVILLDGIVLNQLSSKHAQRGRNTDLGYFWTICKHGQLDGIVAVGLTGLALLSGVLLGCALLLTPA